MSTQSPDASRRALHAETYTIVQFAHAFGPLTVGALLAMMPWETKASLYGRVANLVTLGYLERDIRSGHRNGSIVATDRRPRFTDLNGGWLARLPPEVAELHEATRQAGHASLPGYQRSAPTPQDTPMEPGRLPQDPAMRELSYGTPCSSTRTAQAGGVYGLNRPPVVRAGSLDALRLVRREFGHDMARRAPEQTMGVQEAGRVHA